MRPIIFVFLYLCYSAVAFGQKKLKPQVLVYGDDITAYAAALQSSLSNVPTLWILPGSKMVPELTTKPLSFDNLANLDGGIWMSLLMEMAISQTKSDSIAALVKKDINPQLAANALEKLLLKQTNLLVVKEQKIESMKRNKNTWTITCSNKQKYDVRGVVDATSDQLLHSFTGSAIMHAKPGRLLPVERLNAEQVRTLIASGQSGDQVYGLTFSNMIFLEKDNVLNLFAVQQLLDQEQATIPLKANIGQALGAIVAYTAFFKTAVSKVDVRKLQTELLTYGARIVPFQDIATDDPNFMSIQKIGLSNLFKGMKVDPGYYFVKEAPVRYEEVEPVFNKLFTRSQLWFLDNKGSEFYWKDYLSLLKFVGLRGDEIEKQIAKDWNSKLKFEGNFDVDKLVTRYQFATLLDRYASPYVQRVTQEGQPIH
ncbi:hypothetical protein E2P86_01920 [Sphingobacterium psychroaquaticum]|uniref:hypothetical protein n=1 Tax=Sphingobacterium psychroaquaticum TaxID=561061 RepID=UPI00106C58DE|nr:hypothetical protein [Sphingobacterium psychroaquaticum]QBQ39973.1 hypothetical protein E2P86_01920 [Sphingobacterium psychroaquaticum]